MSTRRKSLSAITADVGPVPEIPVRAEPEVPAAAPPAPRGRTPARKAPPAPARPAARDLAAPARAAVAREALKVDVPAALALLQRLHRYRADKGLDIRDQVAIAVDEWLAREGY